MADLIKEKKIAKESLNYAKNNKGLTHIQAGSQIALYPLYGEHNTYEDSETLVLPVSPADIMFTEDSNVETIKLMNYGELPVAMNRKLATWMIESFFPANNVGVAGYSDDNFRGIVDNNRMYKYWFDISNGTTDPYAYYCDKLLTWKKEGTPLVFFFQTWKGYYTCQIKKFTYGRKDATGNVYYQLEFQEYKEYKNYDDSSATTDYSEDYYYPQEGENILQIAKKIYGDSNKYTQFMDLNNMKNPTDIKAGQAYKVRQ
ncbi:LysM peptidoglycan-binding domain-containing protein [Clostridium beijerinckii]|uniref:LysM peptidoglycan-binding domain-containing protein n=1 Tax=Clostridium beijerinckii TaxID=1520 RepID=UPI0022270EF4|nr:LysM domain-containing protein [Clostridium beijerinckii]UYZ34168.1 LysM peptidoglycan-binding domain-containing protein [Clostridium beijerinckii]